MRYIIGDITRWRVADTEGGVTAPFDCGETPTKCTLDIMSTSDIDVSLELSDGMIIPIAKAPACDSNTVSFIASGSVHVLLDPVDPSALVAVRRYDDIPYAEWIGESFTTYDPSNFVDSDLDRISRLMRHNQMLMIQALDRKYDAKMQAMREEKSHEKAEPDGLPTPEAKDGDLPQERAETPDEAQASQEPEAKPDASKPKASK